MFLYTVKLEKPYIMGSARGQTIFVYDIRWYKICCILYPSK